MRHLKRLVRDFVEASIAPFTAQVYATGQRIYLSFCRNWAKPFTTIREPDVSLRGAPQTDNDLCPVGAVAAYLAVQGREPGPFFKFAKGTLLSRTALVSRMRTALGS